MQITIDKSLCPQNHKCPSIRVCPVGAIQQTGNGLPTIDQGKCIQCEKCVMFCPKGSIHAK